MKKLTISDYYVKIIMVGYVVLFCIFFAIMLPVTILSTVQKNSKPYFIITEIREVRTWEYEYKGIDSQDRTWLYIPQEYGTIQVMATGDTVWVER